jgi:hypothetical protein
MTYFLQLYYIFFDISNIKSFFKTKSKVFSEMEFWRSYSTFF